MCPYAKGYRSKGDCGQISEPTSAKTKFIHVRFMTANIGSMTGKSREITDIMHRRRKIKIACVQKSKWKGSKAKEIGEGFKSYYHDICRARNGIGIIAENVMLNIFSVHAPQVGCP